MNRSGQIFAVFETLNQALRQAFVGILSGTPAARDAIVAVVAELQLHVAADPDAALGLVHALSPQPHSTAHPLYSAILTERIGARLGLGGSERVPVVAAALTCNLAMLPYEERLLGQASRLSADQAKALRRHPDQGAMLLRTAGVASPTWLTIVKQHHERADGSGYPEGLKGGQILRETRLVALTDSYLALVCERAHRTRQTPRTSIRQLFLEGQSEDPELCAAFVKELGVYPPGSGVRLANGELAVVVRRGASAQTPVVRALRSPDGEPLRGRPVRETTEPAYAVSESMLLSRRELGEPGELWGAEPGNPARQPESKRITG